VCQGTATHAGQDQENCQRKYPGLPDWGLGHVEREEQKIKLGFRILKICQLGGKCRSIIEVVRV
jgi:hypothetical protein